jgi:hypothetical protein
VLLVTSAGIGMSEGRILPGILAEKFLTLLAEMQPLPAVICFYTAGVQLACTGSSVLDQLRTLEQRGMHLVVCSTCLNHYDLLDEMEVGIVGGMGDTLTAIWEADRWSPFSRSTDAGIARGLPAPGLQSAG